MNKKTKILLPLIVAVALVLGLWIGSVASGNRYARISSELIRSMGNTPHDKLSYVMQIIDAAYIDPVNMDTIREALMPELMAQLDPHSIYIPATDMSDVNENLEGEFDGIGVVFNMATDTIVVLNVIAGGPSYKAGVMPGDRIVTIDGKTVAGVKFPQDSVMKLLRGKRGTKVNVGIGRGMADELVDIEIIRDKIPINSIDAAFMLTPSTGFIKLSSFSRNSHKELVEAIEKLEKEGMKSMIFDLRDNSGGYLDQAILIANEFLPAGKMIVYTEDRFEQRQVEYSDGTGEVTDIPLVILINEYSASSSEILAGAVQDNDRGTIIGRRSFGKGLVQNQLPLPDGSAVRLTVARYYTPTGRSIQKPYEMGMSAEEYEADILNRYLHNEVFSADSIVFNDSLRFVTEGGKVVYGGGGIMPDIFVPIDTVGVTDYYAEVMNKNILYRYTLDYVDKHRSKVNKLTTIAELTAFLDSDPSLVDDFVRYAEREGVRTTRKEIEASRELLLAELRAYIGRNTPLEDAGFYVNIYPIDNTLLSAVKKLEEE
ncbi:MAG: S41 family peptidase [Tidjanibacter sp.]|nr:S41 family peptidase [Tidjanibacter sp.]